MRYQDHDGTWKDYSQTFTESDKQDLLDFFENNRAITLHEIYLGDRDPNSVVIRHDVDHSLDHAVKFAQWEHEHGIRSSYYVLHTAMYFNAKDLLFENLRLISNMGHEIGIHTDGYGTTGSWPEAIQLIEMEIAKLRELGFGIRGAAAHGGIGDFTDLELFDKMGYKAQDLGLDYEAYTLVRSLTPTINYISDNRGRWQKPLKHDGRQTVILCHPEHWPFE